MTFFSYRLVITPILSAFQRRVSSVLCKFSRKKINFIRVSPPWMVSPGAVRPLRPPLVTPLSVFTTRHYTNPRLLYLTLPIQTATTKFLSGIKWPQPIQKYSYLLACLLFPLLPSVRLSFPDPAKESGEPCKRSINPDENVSKCEGH